MESLETLEELSREVLDDDAPVAREDVDELLKQGEDADTRDMDDFLDQQIEFYDEFLGVDSTELREVFEDDVRYDPGKGQLVKDIASPANVALTSVAAPVTLAATAAFGPLSLAIPATAASTAAANYKASEMLSDGTYIPGRIGVSKDEVPEAKAYNNLASELFHAYQDLHDSDTWGHPFLREGFERAASIKALEQGYPEEAEAYRAHVLLNGYAQAAEIAGEDMELDLSEEQQEQLEENATDPGHTEYNLPASLIYAAEEEHGEEIYKEIFDGDYSSIEEELGFMDGNAALGQKVKAEFWDRLR